MPNIALRFAIDEIKKALAHERMEDGLKGAPGRGYLPLNSGRNKLRPSRKYDLRQLEAVNTPVGREHRIAEAVDNGGHGRAAGRFQLVNDIIRI